MIKKIIWEKAKTKPFLQKGLAFAYYFLGHNYRRIKGANNSTKFNGSFLKNVCFDIAGDNNEVIIEPGSRLENTKFYIRGNDNHIVIKEYVQYHGGSLWIEDSHNSILVGQRTTVENAHLACTDSNNQIIIGDDCMLAYDIDVRTGDSHSIIDEKTGERINYSKSVRLGDRVWVGAHVVILKGVEIGSDVVVATGAVVTKNAPAHSIIAGVPAAVVKNGTSWTRARLS